VQQVVKGDYYDFYKLKILNRKPALQKLNKFSKSHLKKPPKFAFNKKKIFMKFKPLKKFRFWRVYKRIFLFKKKKFTFFKVNLLFNAKRLIKHQFKFIYGYPLARLGYTPSSKYFFYLFKIFWLLFNTRKSIKYSIGSFKVLFYGV